MAGEDHSKFACIDRDLEFEALLITLKDSDTTIAVLLCGRFCNNNMSFWCYVSLCFGPFYTDIAFNRIAGVFADSCPKSPSEYSTNYISFFFLPLLLFFFLLFDRGINCNCEAYGAIFSLILEDWGLFAVI
jgi:hypothetical protein